MATTAITAANITNMIPALTSLKIKATYEPKLVSAKWTDRRFEADLKYGDTVDVPNISSLTPNAVNVDADETSNDILQNLDQIIINQWYTTPIRFGDMHRIQLIPTAMAAFIEKCAAGTAKQMDTSVNALYASFTNSVGTDNTALTPDVLIEEYETLNENDVPEDGRVWIFDPESITDLLKYDVFIKSSYVPEGVMSKGFTGREILGAPVFWTSNLAALNTTYHSAAYLQKDAIALITQMAPLVEQYPWKERHSIVVRSTALWGVKLMRATSGVHIKTRS